MKYYEGHEGVYRRLDAEGQSCWDRTAFDAFCMRPWLEAALARIERPRARVLEIGCGAGPIACFLAARGHEVLGLDIAPTAIAMAQRNAAARGLAVTFAVGDVVELDRGPFDLVVDGHCLHCIVFDDERRRLLGAIRRHLAPGGAFVLETMAMHPAVTFASSELDDEGILWHVRPDSGRTPTRRIRTPEALAAELRANGFAIEYEEVGDQELGDEPWNYRAICR